MTPNLNVDPDIQLRNALLGLAAGISAHHQPQLASTLWLRAQLRERHTARQRAIVRATLPLRCMSSIGILAVVLIAAFALHQLWTTTPAANPAALRTLLTWTTLAAALVLTGCYLLLRANKTFIPNS